MVEEILVDDLVARVESFVVVEEGELGRELWSVGHFRRRWTAIGYLFPISGRRSWVCWSTSVVPGGSDCHRLE